MYSMFCLLWQQLLPHITVMKPMTDLCWVYQQNSKTIMRSANTPETEKTQVISKTYNIYTVDDTLVYAVNEQVLKDAEAHLQLSTEERSYYRTIIDTIKEVLKNTFTDDGQLIVPPVNACVPPRSQDITVHFSFNMAQQEASNVQM